jgi:phosphoglycolate phosphatase-like HAD superfamily hydrolase
MTGGVLVLWDVDHTLVDAGGVGARAFRAAFRQLFGRDDDDAQLPPMAGRTDRAIAIDLLRANGVADPDRHLEDFRAAAEQALVALEGVLRTEGRALPGAADALYALRGAAVQTLLTGNIRAFAEAKMRAFELTDHLDLDIGAYGWAHAVRARLVDMARSTAQARHDREFPGRATVLVGDTPRDVEAALATGAAVVGVATGMYSVDDLRMAGAHTVLGDLTDTDEVLAAITSVGRPAR